MLARRLAGVSVLVSPRSLSRRPPRRASVRRDGPPSRRRVPAPAARSRHRPRDRRPRRHRASRVTLPSGRLREPLDTLVAADAIAGGGRRASSVPGPRGATVPVSDARWRAGRRSRTGVEQLRAGAPALAVAGIARSRRGSSTTCARAGMALAGTLVFRDHHRVLARGRRRGSVAAARSGGRAARPDHREGLTSGCCRSGRFRCRRVRAAYNGARSAARVPALARRLAPARLATSSADRLDPGAPSARPSLSARSQYLAVVSVVAVRAAADARRARRRDAARPRVLRRRSARIAGSRCENLRAAFPVRTDAECRRDRARHVLALRPAAGGAAEVQHDDAASRCWPASSSKAKSASSHAHAQQARRAALHRAFRLLGNQRARPCPDAQADGGAGAAARQSAAARSARVGAHGRPATR